MPRRERVRVIGGGRVDGAPPVRDARPQRGDEGHDHGHTPLRLRADAEAGPHEESQVESADVDKQPFQDVRVTSQMCAHPPVS